MKILVSGATGFVGLHLVRGLAEAGHAVIGVDLRAPSVEALRYLGPLAPRVRLAQADIAVPGSAAAAAGETLDAMVHAAVVTSTPEVDAADPDRVVTANVLGTAEMLRAATSCGVRRFVYISSSGVYGQTDPRVPIGETHPLQLDTLYTMTKFASERLVAAARSGMVTATVRIAAPYGPMEHPTGARTVMSPIYTLVHAAAAGRSVTLSQSDHARDWTHADDIASGIRLLLEVPSLPYDCYNLSSGQVASLAQVSDVLAELAPGFSWSEQAEGLADVVGARTGARGPLDMGRLSELGFTPRWSLRDGLRDTLRWCR